MESPICKAEARSFSDGEKGLQQVINEAMIPEGE